MLFPRRTPALRPGSHDLAVSLALAALPQPVIAGLLRRMTQEGWISRLPGHGWEFLPVLVSEESYDQGYQLRILIEPAAILTDTFHLPPDAISKLRNAQQAMLDGGIEKFSKPETFQIGAQFHENIVAASGNAVLAEMHTTRIELEYAAGWLQQGNAR